MNKDLGSLASQFFNRAKKTFDGAVDALVNAPETYDKYKGYIAQEFYTNGEYDPKKTEAFFNNKDSNIIKYGKSFYNLAQKMYVVGGKVVKKAGHKLDEIVKENFPTSEELDTTYAGIGNKSFIFLKKDYDKCLKFYNIAELMINVNQNHYDRDVLDEILVDIKDSAAGNYGALNKFYADTIKVQDAKSTLKIQVAKDCLSGSDKYLK
jgi:hypothetical protein